MMNAGYQIELDVLSVSEFETVIAGVSRPDVRAGARHLMSNSAVAALANDSRLLSIAQLALGARAVPFKATLFSKSERANWLIPWHQDTALPLVSRFEKPEWGPWSKKSNVLYAHAPAWALSRIVALRVHLDASTGNNGPLRVIPGSHHAGVLSDRAVREYARTRKPIECTVPRGGVLVMRPLLIHVSSKATIAAPRRVIHIEYADSLDLAQAIRLAVA